MKKLSIINLCVAIIHLVIVILYERTIQFEGPSLAMSIMGGYTAFSIIFIVLSHTGILTIVEKAKELKTELLLIFVMILFPMAVQLAPVNEFYSEQKFLYGIIVSVGGIIYLIISLLYNKKSHRSE